MRTLVPVVSVALVLGACTESLAPPPGDAHSQPSSPTTASSSLTTVAEFVGAYDPATGELRIEPLPVEEWQFVDQDGHRLVRQGGVLSFANGYCNALPMGRNGIRLDTVIGSLGLTVADCIDEPGRSYWESFVYGDGAFCATVRLTNDTGKRLVNPVAEIVEITTGYEAYNYMDTGAEPPCCGTGANAAALPIGPNLPVEITGGLFQWADLDTGASADQQWTFRNGGGPLRFRGRVVAQIYETNNGVDDDCDGVVDNLLGEFSDGTACAVDRDCQSGVCSSGVCGVSCEPGFYGPTCDACADCGSHGSCDDGATGTGACMCDPGYAGGACDDCSNGRFGPTCELCPSCGVNGICDEGIDGGGSCICDIGFHGAECQFSCSNEIQDGDEEEVDCGGSCVQANDVVQVVAGTFHTCVRLDDGSVKCWGNNSYGNLGRGDTNRIGDDAGEMGTALIPVDLGSRDAVHLSAGGDRMCALLENGSVKCWGYGANGALGLGDSNHRGDQAGEMGDALPVVALGVGRSATSVVIGWNHTCAVLDDGSLKCWGYNAQGQLGQGHTNTLGDGAGELGDSLPAIDLGTGRTAQSVALGELHTCALLDDGSVKCWGYNGYGAIGSGNGNNVGDAPGEMGDALAPVDLGSGRTALAISSAYQHSCALLDDGSVKCWGYNGSGQLGVEDTTSRGASAGQMGDALPRVNLGAGRSAVAISVGSYHTCAVLDDATLKCWGYNGYGNLGLGDTANRGASTGTMGDALSPVNLGPGRTVVGVAGGHYHTCALLDDASVKCWGYAGYGQLGTGSAQALGTSAGQMGNALPAADVGESATGICVPPPPPPPEMGPDQRIVASRYSTCAIRADGSVKCWGFNAYGQAGVGNTTHYGDNPGEVQNMPTVNLGAGRTAVSLGAGMFHHCAVLDNGTVGCWGLNNGGQLGNAQPGNNWGDASNEYFTPVIPISFGAASAVSVVGGEVHTCALLDNGTVKCWGHAGYGQLGSGNTAQIYHPGQILSMPPVNLGSGRTAVALAAGQMHTCALLDNGAVRCWGYNGYGQLGTGNTQSYGQHPSLVGDAIPTVNLGTGRTAVALSAGAFSTCALLDNGAVRCWGQNGYGQLGTGNTQSYGQHPSLVGDAIPAVNLGSGRTAVSITSGWNHTCAILDNAAVRCWGANNYAQLGTGNTQPYGPAPSLLGDAIPTVNLGTGRTAVGFTGGEIHTCAALDDGTYKCWGFNSFGQLGQGDTQQRGQNPSTLGDALPPINLGGPT